MSLSRANFINAYDLLRYLSIFIETSRPLNTKNVSTAIGALIIIMF